MKPIFIVIDRRHFFSENQKSGFKKNLNSIHWCFLNIQKSEGWYIPAAAKHLIKNPYRDLQSGGTTFGFRGVNYWIADTCFVGKILKYFFNKIKPHHSGRG